MSHDELRLRGNHLVEVGRPSEAIEAYTAAINALGTATPPLLCNRSLCYWRLRDYPSALEDARHSVKIDAAFSKGWYRLASAFIGLRQHAEAIDALRQGVDVDPSNGEIKSALAAIQAEVNKSFRVVVSSPPVAITILVTMQTLVYDLKKSIEKEWEEDRTAVVAQQRLYHADRLMVDTATLGECGMAPHEQGKIFLRFVD